MQVCEVELQVDLVAQDVLAQWAADHWLLHGMLGHHVELYPVGVFTAVVTIGALLRLLGERDSMVITGKILENRTSNYCEQVKTCHF